MEIKENRTALVTTDVLCNVCSSSTTIDGVSIGHGPCLNLSFTCIFKFVFLIKAPIMSFRILKNSYYSKGFTYANFNAQHR